MIKTRAFLLSRNPSLTLDEQFRFVTEDLGIIKVHGFGARSMHSHRSKVLRDEGLFEIYLEKRVGYSLQEVELLRPYDFLREGKLFREHRRWTATLSRRRLLGEIGRGEARALFYLLDSVYHEEYFLPYEGVEYSIMRLGVLRLLGYLVSFNRCDECHQLCSEVYRYEGEGSRFVGEKHILSRETKTELVELSMDFLIFLNEFYRQFNPCEKAFFVKMKNTVVKWGQKETLRAFLRTAWIGNAGN